MTFDILKGLHAVDVMVNSRITLGTLRAAKSNTRAAREAETTRPPVICHWWCQWGPWALSCPWISGVGHATPKSCLGLKSYTSAGWYDQSRDFAYNFQEGNKPLWDMTLCCCLSAFIHLPSLRHFARSAVCICKCKPYLSFHFCFSSLCGSVKADVRLVCPSKLIVLGQLF